MLLALWGESTYRPTRDLDFTGRGDSRQLRDSALQTARAWGYKEHAMTLWACSRAWARKAWMAWYRSAIRCRLEPVRSAWPHDQAPFDGIVTAVWTR